MAPSAIVAPDADAVLLTGAVAHRDIAVRPPERMSCSSICSAGCGEDWNAAAVDESWKFVSCVNALTRCGMLGASTSSMSGIACMRSLMCS